VRLHPDVAAVAAEFGITRPRTLRRLQWFYDARVAEADVAWDLGSEVLTYLGRRHDGSIPVDRAVANRALARL
jgi:hypothetical protein